MLNWLEFIILSFACYRLAQLFALDEGPTFWLFKSGIFNELRIVTGAYRYDKNGQADTALGRMMTCPYCLGMWIAMPLALYATGIYWYSLITWLAIAGLQSFLQAHSNA